MYYINLEYDSPIRYDLAKFLPFEEDVYNILDSSFLDQLRELIPLGYFEVVGEEGRPDLVSWKVYKNTQYWWVIMEFNGLVDFEDLTPGKILAYPSLNKVEDIYFNLKSLQS